MYLRVKKYIYIEESEVREESRHPLVPAFMKCCRSTWRDGSGKAGEVLDFPGQTTSRYMCQHSESMLNATITWDTPRLGHYIEEYHVLPLTSYGMYAIFSLGLLLKVSARTPLEQTSQVRHHMASLSVRSMANTC